MNMELEPHDLRFQYKVIEGQSQSIREMTSALMDQQKTLGDIVQRLVRIESNGVDGRVKALELAVQQLQDERNQRAGMGRIMDYVFKSPLIGWLAGAGAAIWLVMTRGVDK